MTSKHETMKDRKLLYLVFGLLFICIASIWLFTRNVIIDDFKLTQTGQIGDTIGGITSPLINIVGSILVYLSFKEQFRANQIQATALKNEISRNRLKSNAEIILNLYNESKEDFNAIEFNNLKGTLAVRDMINSGAIYSDENFDYYLGILYRLTAINEKVNEDELDESDMNYIKNITSLFYLSKIKRNFESLYNFSKERNSDGYKHLIGVKQNFDKYFKED
jgi:hypothetical protein